MASLSPEPGVVEAADVLSGSCDAVSFSEVADELGDVAVLPPTALSRLAASAAAVGPDVSVWTDVEDAAPDDAEADVELELELEENPAAGRSGKRTSMYRAPAELGEVSTRASDSHLACGRVALPK